MKNKINVFSTVKKYDIIFEMCKCSLQKNYVEVCENTLSNINDVIFYKICNEKWIDVVNLSITAIFFHKKKVKTIDVFRYYYDLLAKKAKYIMEKKNLDYKDAWKNMELSSIKDIIVQKIFRIKNMKKNNINDINILNKIYDNYIDILNYSIFILMKKKFIL
jgi:Domain of Unknown Function (DUF1599).